MSARSWSRTSAKVSVSHGRLCQSLFAHHGRPVSQYHLGDSNNIFFLTLSLVFSVFVTFSEHGDRVSPHPMLSLTQLTLHQGQAGPSQASVQTVPCTRLCTVPAVLLPALTGWSLSLPFPLSPLYSGVTQDTTTTRDVSKYFLMCQKGIRMGGEVVHFYTSSHMANLAMFPFYVKGVE